MRNIILKIIFPLLIISFTLTSCSKIILGLYGIKSIKEIDDGTILKYGRKYNIPVTDTYKLDTSYLSFLFSLDTIKFSSQIKNRYQPLQVLYYDNYGNLKSFHVNCYAGGFPNLKWDRDSIFGTFIPKQHAQLDSLVPLATHLKYLVPLTQTEKLSQEMTDHIIIVHWNRFMGRQSKRLIKIVQDNSQLSRDTKIKIIYANNDNLLSIKERNGSR